MKYKSLKALTDKFSILDIEKSCIQYYILHKSLNIDNSPFLLQLIDSIPNDLLDRSVAALELNTLKRLENALELLIPAEDRKLNGAFFTPNYIVNYIIKELAPSDTDRCIDLSCGCGAFLLGAAKYIYTKYKKSIKEIVKTNLFGADILEYNVRRSKTILALYALEHGEILTENDFNIINCDSLENPWKQPFEVVMGNPPYVKYQDLDEGSRISLIDKWTSISKGTFNLYFAFFELGYQLLSTSGRLGYITPNNYFTSLAGESLRSFFQRTFCISKIVDFGHKKVFDAQTYTAITFLNKHENSNIDFDKITPGLTPKEFLDSTDFSSNPIGSLSSKKWRLLKDSQRESIEKIERSGNRIGELFKIYVGIATLKDQIYFIDGKYSDNLYYRKEYAGIVYKIEKASTRSIYKISDFKSYEDLLGNKRRIIFPYSDDKSATPIPENIFKKKYPYCYKYLLAVKHELKKRDKKVELYPFYLYGRSQGLKRTGKKLLTPTFSKYPRFGIVTDEKALFCNGYGVFFKSTLESDLFNRPEEITLEKNIVAASRIFNSYIMHYYITATSVAIQGGYPCYQKNFLVKFTIPHLDRGEVEFLNKCNQKEADEFLISKYEVDLRIPQNYYQKNSWIHNTNEISIFDRVVTETV